MDLHTLWRILHERIDTYTKTAIHENPKDSGSVAFFYILFRDRFFSSRFNNL